MIHLRLPGGALRALLLATVLAAFPAFNSAQAQRDSADIPDVTSAVAIQNARIISAPDDVIEQGTVVFRDGVIESVGRNVDIPYDARVINGDSLTVYAGFIDALGHAAVPEPDNERPESVPDRSDPPYDRAGIQPDRDVRSLVDASHKSVAAHRKAGFTASHSAPRGRMLPGQTAILLLTGDDVGEMTFAPLHAQFFQFAGASGVYPGTPMGVMAQFRQLYREADRRRRIEAMYESDPTGLSRPPTDEVHDALYPVIERDQPVFAFTDDRLEVHRALTLRDELGFNMVLTGLYEAFDAVETVAESGLPVALSMRVPDKADWMKEAKQDSLNEILENYDPDARTATWRDAEAEKRNLEARQVLARRDFLEMPARFAEADVPFAFITLGVESKDVLSNIRTFIEHGLDTEDAIAALTTNAATVLGLSRVLGTIEPGKMANLTILDGDLADEDSAVQMVVIDGRVYDLTDDEEESK